MATFLNLARGNEIGANCYHIQSGPTGVVLDAGMHPKHDGNDSLPSLELLDGRPVDAVFVSHAHHDHTGSLPILLMRHPDARVFMSEPTYHLAAPLLHNSVNVMKRQRLELGIQEYPFYTHSDIDRCAQRWQAVRLGKRWSVRGHPLADDEQDHTTFTLHHAGHILGSTVVDLVLDGLRVRYTGDINFHDQTLMTRADVPDDRVDVLIVETTRGAQPSDGYCRVKVIEGLLEEILRAFGRGGAVLMPIFAMGKTQELLTILDDAQRRGVLPSETLQIGGLGKVFTQVYDRTAEVAVRARPRLRILDDIRPQVFDWKNARAFKARAGQLLLLPSGMMTPNTTSCRLAPSILPQERHSIIFVGYTDPDSPAGRLRATPRGEMIQLDRQSEPVPIRCDVRHFDFTSHALREDILAYIIRVRPRQCLLVHGDKPALEWFAREINAADPAIRTIIPPPGQEVALG